MFTGIVEETGRIDSINVHANGVRLAVIARLCAAGVKIGDSLAVNGCCLTLVGCRGKHGHKLLEFDLLQETWDRTSFHRTGPGNLVNLERSLAADGRIHGHFVTGHIDGLAKIKVWERRGSDWFLNIVVPAPLQSYLVPKGSIALDGISLTVAAVQKRGCQVWIIPHTYQVTALRERVAGDVLNVETDILAKYVQNRPIHRV